MEGRAWQWPVAVFTAGAAAGALVACALQLWPQPRRRPSVFELDGLYYERLGYAWDHQVKDFKVLYRPLYRCGAKRGSFEAHELAVSHFERWEARFKPVPREAQAVLPQDVRRRLASPALLLGREPLPVPGARLATVAAPAVSCTFSGHGSRTCEAPSLENLLGDFRGFIDTLLEQLAPIVDVSALEMDHLCYRCEDAEQYQMVRTALCSGFGECQGEMMISGRPISTILLREPIRHRGYIVSCIEVPCPKPGKAYPAGLEHAEFAIGGPGASLCSTELLLNFMAKHPGLDFDKSALSKEINADVRLTFETAKFGQISVKFHNRPLYEVIAYEKEQGLG